jgi:hypothetical protein
MAPSTSRWPGEMRASIDAGTLELSTDDLRAESAAEEEDRRRQAQERR